MAAGSAAAPLYAASGPAHQHGTVRLDLAGGRLTPDGGVAAPLEALIGFERPPRTPAERTASDTLMQRMRAAGTLFLPDEAARCEAGPAEVQADLLAPAASPCGQSEHADQAEVAFTCRQPQHLQQVRVGLFEAFPRIQRIDVQIAGPEFQREAIVRGASP